MKFTAENESDNFEYKEHIIFLENKRFEHYQTQINYRLLVGNGTCRYLIGVGDNGTIIGLNSSQITRSVQNLLIIAKNVSKDMEKIVRPKKIAFISLNKNAKLNTKMKTKIEEKTEEKTTGDIEKPKPEPNPKINKYIAYVELYSNDMKYTESDIITFSESDSDTDYN